MLIRLSKRKSSWISNILNERIIRFGDVSTRVWSTNGVECELKPPSTIQKNRERKREKEKERERERAGKLRGSRTFRTIEHVRRPLKNISTRKRRRKDQACFVDLTSHHRGTPTGLNDFCSCDKLPRIKTVESVKTTFPLDV